MSLQHPRPGGTQSKHRSNSSATKFIGPPWHHPRLTPQAYMLHVIEGGQRYAQVDGADQLQRCADWLLAIQNPSTSFQNSLSTTHQVDQPKNPDKTFCPAIARAAPGHRESDHVHPLRFRSAQALVTYNIWCDM